MAKSKKRVDWKTALTLAKRRYSRAEAESFYDAMYALYRMILEEKPDLVVWPLRGTWSFVRILRLIANAEKNSSALPKFCQPKIGQVHSEKELAEGKMRSERALTQQEKMRLLHDALLRHPEVTKKDSPKIFLVDEVLTGGAIFKNYTLLKTVLRQIGVRRPQIITVGIEHPGEKRKDYEAMAKNIGMRRLKLKRLFTVDKLQFMYPMTRRPPREGDPKLLFYKKSYKGTQQLMQDIWEVHRERMRQHKRRV
ncbi:MAG: hypothetical protein J7L44_00620 [Candidatus Diapherotrites archaeon]|nr:hypothetical protein [Candidatus Diapherotrites archaeon]